MLAVPAMITPGEKAGMIGAGTEKSLKMNGTPSKDCSVDEAQHRHVPARMMPAPENMNCPKEAQLNGIYLIQMRGAGVEDCKSPVLKLR